MIGDRVRKRGAWIAIVSLALCVGLVVPSSAFAERTIGLSSGTFEPSLAPGQSASDLVMVANNGDEPFMALIYTADIVADEEGKQDYVRPAPGADNYLSSAASWIRLEIPDATKVVANTPYLEIAPGEEFPVKFEVVVPPGAAPGDYNAAIFFEMFDFAEVGGGGAVSRAQGRIGSRIDLRVVGDIVDKVEIGPLLASQFAWTNKTEFDLRVRNTGNIDNKITTGLALVGEGEEVVWTDELEADVNLYAGDDRTYGGGLNFEGVGFGKYTLRGIVEYQRELGDAQGTFEDASDTVERSIWVIPLWIIIVVIVILALPVLYVVYRVSTRGSRRVAARRSEREEAREPEAETQVLDIDEAEVTFEDVIPDDARE